MLITPTINSNLLFQTNKGIIKLKTSQRTSQIKKKKKKVITVQENNMSKNIIRNSIEGQLNTY